VPVANASAVGLREVISELEIREIFDILRERTIAFDNQTWNRRYRGFMDKIKTGSIYDVAEVLRDLYRLKTDKQLSFGEPTDARYGPVSYRKGNRDCSSATEEKRENRDRGYFRLELRLDRRVRCAACPLARRPSRIPKSQAFAGFPQAGHGGLRPSGPSQWATMMRRRERRWPRSAPNATRARR